ncbi:hypothetical protein PspLS_06625 [Pyricularia sp. CBS 133598]|nr:hypothetical protein PspLS_06625 [Pyricularia sp. CBS 133598]
MSDSYYAVPPGVQPNMGAPSQGHRPRTESRGSIQSVPTQQSLEAASFDGNSMYSNSWMHDRSHHRELAPASGSMSQMTAHNMSTEDMMLQAAPHLQPGRTYSMDSTMSSMNHTMSYQGHANVMPQQSMSAHSSFMDMDSHSIDRDDQMDGDSVTGAAGTRKGTRSSANNELEMRQLYMQNKDRALTDIARELQGNERGPQSERQRQAFAMLWIAQVCSKGKSSVPRGRVYANYASKCASERVTVLNPASFGKLVRVIFPKLKTRRLGVRGESKYHYVDFMMNDEQPDVREDSAVIQVPLAESVPNFNARPSDSSAITAARAVLPSPDAHQPSEPRIVRSRSRRNRLNLFRNPRPANIDELNLPADKIELEPFLSEPTTTCSTQDPLPLPKIESFLPPGTDRDAAKSLEALYLSHCTSLVECVRFCREKAFFHLYTSFLGTLTMPVQRLFAHPDIAQWIEECDFVLYQRMMRILHGLSLQVVPKPVLDAMRNISDRLVPRIRDAFQGQPPHVMRAKEAPAVIFAALLDRELRVNLAAHAAANMLAHAPNRNEMYQDFITLLSYRKIAENVPRRAMDEVADILLKEIRDLIAPAEIDWDEVESKTTHGAWLAVNGGPPIPKAPEADTTRVLDLWLAFLRSLPSRFPYASASDIVCYLDRVGSAIMRDLTICAGKSFGTWWVTKCWIDEMMSFESELGGFLRMTSTKSVSAEDAQKSYASENRETSVQESTLGRASEEHHGLSQSQPQPDRAPFPGCSPANGSQEDASTSINPDDSGIGIRTPDEDFPMDSIKFDFPPEPTALATHGTDTPVTPS